MVFSLAEEQTLAALTPAQSAAAVEEATGIAWSLGLTERLAKAYPSGVPRDLAEVFAWECPLAHTGRPQFYGARLRDEARKTSARANDLERREKELAAKLEAAQTEYDQLCADLNRPQLGRITIAEVGAKLSAKTGGERLIADLTAALDQTRSDLQQAQDAAHNFRVLSQLAEVIAETRPPDGNLVRSLGLADAMAIYPEWRRAELEKEAREREAAQAVERARFEREWGETQSRIAEEQRKTHAARALVDALDFEGLLAMVYRDAEPGQAVRRAGLGPNTVNSDQLHEAAVHEINRMQERSTDPAYLRACERLRDFADIARFGRALRAGA